MKKAKVEPTWRGSHNDLCQDLAAHLRMQGYMAWVEVKRVGQWSYGDAGRVDVVALAPWTGRTTFTMIAFEVKVGRRDLAQDVQKGKWRRYAAEYGIPHVAFAFPEGIAEIDDVPADAGMWVRRADGWKRRRAGKSLAGDQRKIDPLLLLAMLSTPQSTGERRRTRILIPDSVEKAIEAVGDDEFARLIRYDSRFAAGVGHELAMRLATKEKQVEQVARVQNWAFSVLSEVAELLGCSVDELKANLGKGYELGRALRAAVALSKSAGLIEKMLSAADWALRSATDTSLAQLRQAIDDAKGAA